MEATMTIVAQPNVRPFRQTEPLGTGGQQALVVFEHNCPNNTLPLLWKKTDAWTPVFERLTAR
jgi:hypothetical protein